MTDVLTAQQRRYCMSRIQSRDTKPEMIVRGIVHRLGYRFRLHRSDLPGKPDLVLPRHEKIIFVHGCFWHQHSNCRYATMPRTRRKFWMKKLGRNRERDQTNLRKLRRDGWSVMVVWECQTRVPDKLAERIVRFMQK